MEGRNFQIQPLIGPALKMQATSLVTRSILILKLVLLLNYEDFMSIWFSRIALGGSNDQHWSTNGGGNMSRQLIKHPSN